MEPEYKAIIDQRRALLVERVVWSNKFCEKLRKAVILPRSLLDEIERDMSHNNRTYVLLARLVARNDPTLYQRFCDVLSSTGQAALANLLLQDRDNIVWDFDVGQHIKTIEDYANVINETLLQRLQNMEDPHIRAIITDEVRRRVTRLSRFLLDEMREHEHLRATMLGLIGMGEGELRVDIVRSDLQKRPYLLFDNALENTRKKNIVVSQCVRHCIYGMEDEKQRLIRTLAEGKQMLEACNKKVSELEKAVEVKGDAAFFYLQKVIMDQDDTIAELHGSIKSYEELVNMPRGDLIELLSSIRNSCPRANSLPMPRFTDAMIDVANTPSNDVTAGDALRRHVKALLDLTEQQKLRGQQTSIKMAELDRERGRMKTLLNTRGATPLPSVLSQQLKAFREQKFEMNDTIRRLRARLQEANNAREEMEKKVEELSHIMAMDPTSDGDERQVDPKGRRVRKKSARGRRVSRRVSPAARSEGKQGLAERLAVKLLAEEGMDASGAAWDTNNNNGAGREQGLSSTRQTLIAQYVNMQTNAPQTSGAPS